MLNVSSVCMFLCVTLSWRDAMVIIWLEADNAEDQ